MNIEITKKDNEELNICVNGVWVYSLPEKKDLASLFAKYRGVKEYDGIVADIQTWFYGSLEKSAWCATALCYFANQLGILNSIGGKNSNAFNMMLACIRCNKGEFYSKSMIPKKLLRNDILFWLWDGTVMTETSNKHVGVCEYDSELDTVYCIGGNQKDKICTLEYNRKYLYAVYRLK